MIYFDQAATSYPKPHKVIDAMVYTMKYVGASPGRGGHQLEQKAAEIVSKTRKKIAQLFGCSSPNRIVFYQNATIALNQAIKGLPWKTGDHIIATASEHNAVQRPLQFLKETYGVKVTYIYNTNDFQKQFQKIITPTTKAIVMTHACNVTGRIFPVEKIAKQAKQKNIVTIVDASQTAGHLPIHMKEESIDMLAFPAHKGLRGPQGIGVLLVERDLELQPLHHGGTGVYSEDPNQPTIWPNGYESGTLNTPGIAGLYEALKFYEANYEQNVSRETFLMNKLFTQLQEIEQLTIYSHYNPEKFIPIIAFNVNNIPSQQIAIILDSYYRIAVRAGFHCNPLSHKIYQTLDQGMIRISLNSSNTEDEIDQLIQAIREISSSYHML